MKLFTKTFLFFISIIIIQSNLTFFIITNIIKKNNQEDAKKELTEEASFVYESFNAWKRSLWIDLIRLREDGRFKRMLLDLDSISTNKQLFSYIRETVLVGGIDCMVIRSTVSPHVELIPYEYSIFTFSDLQSLSNTKVHPYLQTALLGTGLNLVGTCSVLLSPDFTVDVFLIKHIGQSFCQHLTAERRSGASFVIGDQTLVGDLRGLSIFLQVDALQMQTVYRESYDVEIEDGEYNIALHKLGVLETTAGARPLFLVTSLSNAPFHKRLVAVKKIVLSVSLLGALLTAVLSLFLSRNISRPVKKLLRGMYRVKNGNYDTAIGMKSGSEMGELLHGFNEMALKLSQDKAQMEDYIREIIMLKDYNEKILHSIRAGIAIINPQFRIEKANSSFLQYFQLDEQQTIGARIQDAPNGLIDEDILEQVRLLLLGKKEFYSKVKRSKDHRVYEIKLYPLAGARSQGDGTAGCVFTVDDISEKLELEEKIFQAEKLSSLSVLSAGVAHEINNPLSSIMSNVQNLMEEEWDDERKVSLGWIEQETRRIARTVQALLNFSSSDARGKQGSDVNEVIAQVIGIIKYSIPRDADIAIETDLKGDLPKAVINEDELQQVIINLVHNSIQAVENCGVVSLRTSASRSERRINIVVQDNGRGIQKEHIPHIFDPFFTTKRNGQGTGLGLSVVYGIVRKQGGHIHVESASGKGTRITLQFPTL
jgi:signal transduction histidine kinase